MTETLPPQIEPEISLELFRILMNAVKEAEGERGERHRVLDLTRLHSALDNPNTFSPSSTPADQWEFMAAEYRVAAIVDPGKNLLETRTLLRGASITDEAQEAINMALTNAREAGKLYVDKSDLLKAVREIEERVQAQTDLDEILKDPDVPRIVKKELVRNLRHLIRKGRDNTRLYR